MNINNIILEQKILKILTNSTITPTMRYVINEIRTIDPQILTETIKQAVWRLIDRGQLILSSKRTLIIPLIGKENIPQKIYKN